MLMARNAPAIPRLISRLGPRFSLTGSPVVRRAAMLALCAIAGGAAATGWYAWHGVRSAADRQSSRSVHAGDSARARTNSALAESSGAPASPASAVARAAPSPAITARPNGALPATAAAAPPDEGKLASASAPLPPAPSANRALPPVPPAIASSSAPAPLAPPPSATPALPSAPRAVASSSVPAPLPPPSATPARPSAPRVIESNSAPAPLAPAPSESPTPPSTSRAIASNSAPARSSLVTSGSPPPESALGARPAHDVEPKATGLPPSVTNSLTPQASRPSPTQRRRRHANPASRPGRSGTASTGTAPIGTPAALAQQSHGRLVAPPVIAAAKPPPANGGPSVPAEPERQSARDRCWRGSGAWHTLAGGTPGAETAACRILACEGAALPRHGGAASRLTRAILPGSFRHSLRGPHLRKSSRAAGPDPYTTPRRSADRFPAYATDGPVPAPHRPLAEAAGSAGGWGPLSLDELRRYGSPSRPCVWAGSRTGSGRRRQRSGGLGKSGPARAPFRAATVCRRLCHAA